MSTNPKDIKGTLVVTVHAEAQPGKADEFAQILANLKARADSDQEPGTLKYFISHFGDSFALYEEYTSGEAFAAHCEENPLYQEFVKIKDTLLQPFAPLFWPANSFPEPTVSF